MSVQSFITEIKSPYGGYEMNALFAYGWSVVAGGIIVSLIITSRPWKNKSMNSSYEENSGLSVAEGEV